MIKHTDIKRLPVTRLYFLDHNSWLAVYVSISIKAAKIYSHFKQQIVYITLSFIMVLQNFPTFLKLLIPEQSHENMKDCIAIPNLMHCDNVKEQTYNLNTICINTYMLQSLLKTLSWPKYMKAFYI